MRMGQISLFEILAISHVSESVDYEIIKRFFEKIYYNRWQLVLHSGSDLKRRSQLTPFLLVMITTDQN